MKAYFWIITLSFLLLAGCSRKNLSRESQSAELYGNSKNPANIIQTSEANGKQIFAVPNQNIIITLDLHSDGGYQWTHNISDSLVAKLDSTKVKPKDSVIILGGLMTETFYFRVIRSGTCSITLSELRVWEKNVPPINTIRFDIIAK